MRKTFCFILGTLAVAGIVLANAAAAADPLLEGFRQPPPAARPSVYWLWLNGHVDRDHIEKEIRQYRDLGISGLLIFDMGARGKPEAAPPAGPPFLSDESVDLIAQSIRLAGKYGLEVQLAACSSWDLGGSWVPPEQASMALYRTELVVEGPADHDAVLPFPELPKKAPRTAAGKPAFARDIALLAVPGEKRSATPLVIPDTKSVIDLTGQLTPEGRLRWKVPPGKWTLLRFVCANTGETLKVPSPNSDGLATDHFSAEATRAFIQHVVDRLRPKVGDFRKTALKQLYLPSYEVRGATWTPDFIAQFRGYRGYDMTPYLPALADCTVGGDELTQRFLYDYRKTLGDLLVDAYYRAARQTANRVGLGIEAEAGGPGPPTHQVPVDALKALGAIDELRGEFWPWREHWPTLWVVKETACAAHVYGHTRVHMEAFTGFRHWQDGPWELKPSADRAFCEGMNRVVWHTSCHLPPGGGLPGWVYGAGSHLNPNVVWWPMAKPFIDYLSRTSFLLQQGLFVGDVCFYYGDQGFNFVPPKHVMPGLGFGYDYDVINAEALLARMSVRNGRLALPDGLEYELLVLPEREDMDLAVLQKIEELVRAGATVVGPKPTRANGLTDYPARDAQVRALADKLWGPANGETIRENNHGQGKIVWGRPLKDILAGRKIGPDFAVIASESKSSDGAGPRLDYVHRHTPDADIYFIRNQTNRWETLQVQFRVRGKAPELWLPDTGEIMDAPAYRPTAQGTQVGLRLPPYGAVFVVFRKPLALPHLVAVEHSLNSPDNNPAAPIYEVTRDAERSMRLAAFQNGTYRLRASDDRTAQVIFDKIPEARQIEGPWQVHFTPDRGAPEQVVFDSLISWTRHEQEGIRYFSGIGRYETEFEIPAAWLAEDMKLTLDLGRLWAVGQVYLNGQSLGILWKPPYRVDVTGAAKASRNRLAVEVANTWSNRLVGDAHSPPDRRFCRTNIERSGTPGIPWKDVPLNESGLLGPVRLLPGQVKAVENWEKGM